MDLVNDVLSKKKYFNPQGWEPFGRSLTRSKCFTRFDWSRGPLEIHHSDQKKHRDLANDNRVHPLLDRTPQKHQETEGMKSRTGSTFKTEVETTKGQL